MNRLKYKDIAPYREQELAAQRELCALCGEKIDGDAVLDHDHKTGLVRRVLHRGCNALLGKIENNLARNKITPARLQGIAHNLITYVTESHTEILHPKHGAKRRRTRRR
jgi:hypothetical protein